MSTVEEALEAISVAVSLGMEIPAPEGTVAYTVHVRYISDEVVGDRSIVGICLSEESARNALASWILGEWKEDLYMPWEGRVCMQSDVDMFEEKFQVWVNEHTVEDVISEWREAFTGDYIISKGIVTHHRTPCGKDTS